MWRRVVADEDPDHQVRGVADEPGILFLVGGAGLARDGNVWNVLLDHGGRAALHHPFHDRGHLVGGVRIYDLLAVVLQHRFGLSLPLVGLATGAIAVVLAPESATPA